MGSNGTESATHQSSSLMSSSPSYIDASVTSLSSVPLDEERTETEVVAVTVEATTEDFSKMIGFPLINETL